MPDRSPYRREYYEVILREVQSRFQLDPDRIPQWTWIAWRRQIKAMFDRGVLISEILQAIPEAGEKRRWPGGTAFWHRVEDVVLKNRREQQPSARVAGLQSTGTILDQRNPTDVPF